MIEKLLSNSNGTNLITHLKATSKIAGILCDRMGLSDDKKIIIQTSALLHDIGKSYSVFYDYISTGVESDEFLTNKILHHEVSWAVLLYLLVDNKYKHNILHAIYWHHAKDASTMNKEYASSIIEKINVNDRLQIVQLFNFLTNDNKTIDVFNDDINNDEYPIYFKNKSNDNNNAINFLTMGCLVSADRYVSIFNQEKILINDDYCFEIVNKIEICNKRPYSIPEHYDLERFNKQVEYVSLIPNNTTTIFKAPAGFGKTPTGLICWNTKSRKKLIWVCPRNVVAETVYQNIINELDALNLNDTKVELYLTSNVVKSNYNNYSDFSSDIIVTNIDNFLNPTINNWVKNRMFNIFSSDVIFDEFHEFIGDEPLFASFVNVMRIRHRYTNSNTLLLSATPTLMNFLWDTINNETIILPNNQTHYPPVHNKPYNFNYVSDFNSILPQKNTLFATNAIKSSQILTINKHYSNIVHSKFTDTDRKRIITNLFNMYGKNSTEEKKDVISAPLVRAAMDLSFQNLYIIIKSIEDFLQTIGRINRWNEYDYANVYVIIDINNPTIKKSEIAAIKYTYNETLYNIWVDFIKKEMVDGNSYNLTELYNLYNKFNITYKTNIIEYINNKFINSTVNLSKIYPKKYLIPENDTSTKIKTSKLRDNGNEKIYCIYRNYFNDDYTEPFLIDMEDENINENSLKFIVKNIERLITDERFEYTKYTLKYIQNDINKLKIMATNPKTPYISFNKVYHQKLGIIDKNLC